MTWCSRLIDILQSLQTPRCRIVKIHPDAQVPTRGTQEAAGYDITSAEDITVPAGGRVLIHTGLAVAPPKNCHIEIRPRSGLALKHGITVLNTPGTIDADYRGEIMVILFNTSKDDFEVHIGDRIAQAVIMRHENTIWQLVTSFEDTPRGEKGFGSTGR
jgi:dUTP pyrophosphatase